MFGKQVIIRVNQGLNKFYLSRCRQVVMDNTFIIRINSIHLYNTMIIVNVTRTNNISFLNVFHHGYDITPFHGNLTDSIIDYHGIRFAIIIYLTHLIH